jgi:hypothetical protein
MTDFWAMRRRVRFVPFPATSRLGRPWRTTVEDTNTFTRTGSQIIAIGTNEFVLKIAHSLDVTLHF